MYIINNILFSNLSYLRYKFIRLYILYKLKTFFLYISSSLNIIQDLINYLFLKFKYIVGLIYYLITLKFVSNLKIQKFFY